jgi:hypothetical protein
MFFLNIANVCLMNSNIEIFIIIKYLIKKLFIILIVNLHYCYLFVMLSIYLMKNRVFI